MKLYIFDANELNNDIVFNKLFSMVSYYRQQKIMNFRFRKDKNLSLGAGILIDKGLKEYGLLEKHMTYTLGKNEKPFFSDYPNIHFNVSHSKSKVICAFSENTIGCDIEEVTSINLDIAKNYFFDSEYEYIKNQKTTTERENAFFRLWTLKESFLKTTGFGISISLNNFEIYFKNDIIKISQNIDKFNYYFHEYECEDNYKISCCSRVNDFCKNIIKVNVHNFY